MNYPKYTTVQNLFTLESTTPSILSCVTSVYSFGNKLLESQEIKYPTHKRGRYLYRFDFVGGFFNGIVREALELTCFDGVRMALENITLLQVRELFFFITFLFNFLLNFFYGLVLN
jgi:hypothetical protein